VPAGRGRLGYFTSRCYAEGLSKARVSGLVGSDDGLSSERGYVTSTLPRGVLAGVADSLRGDFAGLSRAGAIVLGLAVTVAGYAAGRASLRRGVPPSLSICVNTLRTRGHISRSFSMSDHASPLA
jgi:hypothetical protein